MKDLPANCKNCGTELRGRYCSSCGEKTLLPEDHSLRHYLSFLINAFTFADSKFWRTLKAVVLRPGELSKAYMQGPRSPYMPPLAFFFLANFIYFLLPLFETFNTSLDSQLNHQNFSIWIAPMVNEHLAATGMDMDAFRTVYEPASTSNAKLLIVVMVGLLFIPLALVFYGKLKYISASVTAAFEMMAFHLWVSTIALSAFMFLAVRITNMFGGDDSVLINDEIISLVIFGLQFYVTMGLARRFYGCTMAGSIWRTVVMFAGVAFALSGYRLILFLTTFMQVT